MSRRAVVVSALAIVLASTATARPWSDAIDAGHGPRWDTARVVAVDPILAPGEPRYRRQCWDEPVRAVTREVRPAPGSRHGGVGPNTQAVLGGIVGAAIGHQIGDGSGQRAATVAGALLGGAIARDRHPGYRDAGYDRSYVVERESVRYEQRCESVPVGRVEDRVVGYRVEYEYAGQRYLTETPYHPGRTLRVRVDVVPEI